MNRMLRLKVELFDLATEQEKPETYNREFNRAEMLQATVDAINMLDLLTILKAFLDANKPRIEYVPMDQIPKEFQ